MAKKLCVGALNGPVEVSALDVKGVFTWRISLTQELVGFRVAPAVMLSEQEALAHTLWCQVAVWDLKRIWHFIVQLFPCLTRLLRSFIKTIEIRVKVTLDRLRYLEQELGGIECVFGMSGLLLMFGLLFTSGWRALGLSCLLLLLFLLPFLFLPLSPLCLSLLPISHFGWTTTASYRSKRCSCPVSHYIKRKEDLSIGNEHWLFLWLFLLIGISHLNRRIILDQYRWV